jgi:hypothetical protein
MDRIRGALALVVSALFLLALAAVSSASNKESECCFAVASGETGEITLTWNNNPQAEANIETVHTGTELLKWDWGNQELDEYSESQGVPSIERAALDHKQIRGVDLYTESSVSTNEKYWYAYPAFDPSNCDLEANPAPRLTEEPFASVESLEGTPYAVRQRLKGQKYVLEFTTPGDFVNWFCADGPLGVDGPLGANGYADASKQPDGPGFFFVKLPPRAFLRHSHGQPDRKELTMVKHVSFSACSGAPATAMPCDRYTLNEDITYRARFTWFDSAMLREKAKQL